MSLGLIYLCSAAAFASTVPVNTGHGAASPHPVKPLSVEISRITLLILPTSPLP